MFNLFKNRKDPNVGRVFYSPYLKRNIEVVAFNNDDKWWFCFEGTNGTELYKEYRAGTKLSYMEDNGLEMKK